ncbi:MAG: hypothetical protein PVF05_03385 [Gemmatimonadales bacterium]
MNGWARAALIATVACAAGPGAATAQEALPRFPFGVPAIVLPVQSSEPTAGGRWPGRASSQEGALRAMDAELEFALEERRGAEGWALPSDLRRSVRRNPTVRVDPDRVAYQGLLAEPDRREQIYEPLHGELRALAALHGTRFVVLPLRLRIVAAEEPEAGTPRTTGACDDGSQPVRAELLLALIDIRRSAVLWHGSVDGAAGCPDSGALLASLAAVVARRITES